MDGEREDGRREDGRREGGREGEGERGEGEWEEGERDGECVRVEGRDLERGGGGGFASLRGRALMTLFAYYACSSRCVRIFKAHFPSSALLSMGVGTGV